MPQRYGWISNIFSLNPTSQTLVDFFVVALFHLMKLLKKISKIGTVSLRDEQSKRYVVLTNRASLYVSIFTLLLALVGMSFFGLHPTVKISIFFSGLFLFPLYLNWLGLTNLSRVLFTMMLSVVPVVVSLFDKFYATQIEDFQYFEFRFILLAASLFPFVLFSIRERNYWLAGLVSNLLLTIFYDAIHNMLGVGFYQTGFISKGYFFTTYMMTGAFLIICSTAYFLKKGFEKAEDKNIALIQRLSEQKEEIMKANEIIGRKKEELAVENIKLSDSIIEKNNQLIKTNQELVQHNNDLQQFSYTISHNLRGPLASLQGLLNLFNEAELAGQNQELFPHFKSSIASLDHTVRDLGNIIDVRNGLNRVREPINIRDEVNHIITLLGKEFQDNHAKVEIAVANDLTFVSVKPMVSSILHNLISNAIKYRSPDRAPQITIAVSVHEEYAQLVVADNGLGIDLATHRDKLFGIYKRFHTHVAGKGLGLFLVKLQAESLGGHVEVSSKPDVGTTFRIFIRIQEKPD